MKTLRAAKSFVSTHKVGIAVTVTAVVCYAIHRAAVKEWNGFLKDHELLDVYYAVNED